MYMICMVHLVYSSAEGERVSMFLPKSVIRPLPSQPLKQLCSFDKFRGPANAMVPDDVMNGALEGA